MKKPAQESHNNIEFYGKWIEISKIVIEGAKVLSWPLLVLIGIIIFYAPLMDISKAISTNFSEVKKITMGFFTLEIDRESRKDGGDPELASQIGSLSEDAIKQLLRMPSFQYRFPLLVASEGIGTTLIGLPTEKRLISLKRLSEKQYISFSKPLDPFVERILSYKKPLNRRDDADYQWFAIPYDSKSIEIKNLMAEETYGLTEKGQHAVNTITKVVASMLIAKQE